MQFVEEGEYVDVFARDVRQGEDVPEFFCQEIEWQLQEFFLVCGERFRQDFFCRHCGDVLQGGLFFLLHIAEVVQHQVFLGYAIGVLFVDEQSQSGNNHLYANRCFEQERFVADETNVWGIFGKHIYQK